MNSESKRRYLRFQKPVVIQHSLLTISFLALAVSGYKLYGYNMNPGIENYYFIRNVLSWNQLHLTAGIFLSLTIIWHFLYILFSIYGHNDFMQMFLNRKNLRALTGFGFRKISSAKERFGLQEKITYWVVGFYIVLMAITGILRYTVGFSNSYIPQSLYILMLEFHGFQGLFLGIVLTVWHLYSIFLKPGRFPGTMSWWDGKISESELKSYDGHEKPED